MASTTEATRLTEFHRQGQARIGQATVDLMSRSWRLVDSTDLDGSFPRWLRVSETIIRSQAAQSARLSAGYYSAFRSLELGEPLPVDPVVDLSADTIAANMRVTGPGAVKRAMRVNPVERAMEIGRAMSARSASRLALSGGRGTIETAIASDRECIGYARATGGVACAFCSMLASRGVAYKTRESARFQAHDGCNCTAEPVYSDRPELPPGSEQYRELWDEVTAGMSGKDARNAFRRALAAR